MFQVAGVLQSIFNVGTTLSDHGGGYSTQSIPGARGPAELFPSDPAPHAFSGRTR